MPVKPYRINQRIPASTVRVIDDSGEQLGIISLRDALTLAREKGLDLVEVAPGAEPPVCRILDYGKFRYQQAKKEREGRKGQKSSGMREVRVRPSIGSHDLNAKLRTAQKLLLEGARVKVSVLFRGRAITHPELGMVLLKRIAEELQTEAKLEHAPSMEGRMLSIVLAPTGRRDGSTASAAQEHDATAPAGENVLAAREKGNAETQDA